MYIPHVTYPFTHPWILESGFQILTIVTEAVLNMHVNILFLKILPFSLGVLYSEGRLLNQMEILFLICFGESILFPSAVPFYIPAEIHTCSNFKENVLHFKRVCSLLCCVERYVDVLNVMTVFKSSISIIIFFLVVLSFIRAGHCSLQIPL